jgi:hypothetical protein
MTGRMDFVVVMLLNWLPGDSIPIPAAAMEWWYAGRNLLRIRWPGRRKKLPHNTCRSVAETEN